MAQHNNQIATKCHKKIYFPTTSNWVKKKTKIGLSRRGGGGGGLSAPISGEKLFGE